VLILIVCAAAAAQLDTGSLHLRLLSPLGDPYGDEGDVIDRGAQFGFHAGYDFELLSGFYLGPRIGGLFYRDGRTEDSAGFSYHSDLDWVELIFGGGLRYQIYTGGDLEPWFGVDVGLGWANLNATLTVNTGGLESSYEDSGQGTGLAVELRGGVCYWLSRGLGLSLAAEYHLNTVKELSWEDEDGEVQTGDLEDNLNALGLGFGVFYQF